jgi:glycosyltransferase involved in cell wall biosynthesis
MLDDWSMSQRRLKKRAYLALLGRSLIGNATFVHCTAEGELAQVRKWLYGAEGIVAPLVLDLSPFLNLPGPDLAREEFQMDPAGNEILFLSRIHVKKGIERLLAAMQTLHERGINCKAVIAGAGDPVYIESLRRCAEQCGIADSIRFPGHVGGDLKISLYEAADLFALPTSQENVGFVLPESLACRTPVVTTKAVDIWPELERAGGAVIIENNPQALADALAQLLADKRGLAEMGDAARDWVLKTYSAETVLNQYVDMYRKAAQSAVSTSS